MNIRIPRRLYRILQSSEEQLSNVEQFLEKAEHIYLNQPYFFPDYTFHGTEHINTVLEYADQLIAPKTFGELTPRDVACLVYATALCDIGMYLPPEPVWLLIFGDRCHDSILPSGHDTWSGVWNAYIEEINGYPPEKRIAVFGTTAPANSSYGDWPLLTDHDRRIFGEFLRRYRFYFAYAIAVNGIPTDPEIDLFQYTLLDYAEQDLIGLLACSHGMPIQDSERHIRSILGPDTRPNNVPVYYLMAVLRLAHSLDISGHQTPSRRIPDDWMLDSQISKRSRYRWNLQQSQLYIYAEPSSSIEYFELDENLKQIQTELDLCWLVIAEKYYGSRYQLTIHRITSNIYEPDVLDSLTRHGFLPKEVRLGATTAFIHLMIPTLYENTPSYAVRELIQNAVDACTEREYSELLYGRAYKGRIRICLDAEENTFTIIDNGIGMNEDILTNYCLSAGASFRTSGAWLREYATDGHPQIPRTGKFGVGFLSAFLLGSRITIETRHTHDDVGYRFNLDTTDRPLNILRTNRDEPGTTITIRLYPGVCEALEADRTHPWDQWYAPDEPSIVYEYGNRKWHSPALLQREPCRNADWFALDSAVFSSFQWKPAATGVEKPAFYCNGIRIYSDMETDLSMHGLNISMPHVSLTDVDCALDVNLTRTKIHSFPEREALLQEVFRYCIARLLLTPWDNGADFCRNLTLGFDLDGSGSGSHRSPFLLTQDGFTLNYVSSLAAMGVDGYLILYCTAEDLPCAVETACRFLPDGYLFAIIPQNSSEHTAESVEDLFSGKNALFSATASRHGYTRYLTHIWLQENTFRRIQMNQFPRLRSNPQLSAGSIRALDWLDGALAFSSGMPISREYFDNTVFPAAVQLDLRNEDYYSEKYSDPDLLFPRIFRELLTPDPGYPRQDMWIPFDMAERKKKFPKAFESLDYYIQKLSNQ